MTAGNSVCCFSSLFIHIDTHILSKMNMRVCVLISTVMYVYFHKWYASNFSFYVHLFIPRPWSSTLLPPHLTHARRRRVRRGRRREGEGEPHPHVSLWRKRGHPAEGKGREKHGRGEFPERRKKRLYLKKDFTHITKVFPNYFLKCWKYSKSHRFSRTRNAKKKRYVTVRKTVGVHCNVLIAVRPRGIHKNTSKCNCNLDKGETRAA